MIVEVIDSQTQLPIAAAVVVRGHGRETLGIGRTDNFTGEKEFVFKSDVLKTHLSAMIDIKHDDYHAVELRHVKLNQNLRIAMTPKDIDTAVSDFSINHQAAEKKVGESLLKRISNRIKKFFFIMAPGQNPLPVNQYFDYNPMTGLNYYSGQCCFEVTTVDPNLTQKDYNQIIEEWIHYAYEFGIALVNSTKVNPLPRIISNFNISLTKF